MGTLSGGPNVVVDGLVLSLDAANTKSYPGSGTTWTDLSRSGNNGTLTNGPTFNSGNGGSIVFDGTNDYVGRNTALNTGQNFTVNAWIFPTLLGTTRRAIIGNSYNYSGRNGWFFSTGGGGINNTFFLSLGNDDRAIVAPVNTLSTNTWQYVSAVVTNSGGTITLYKNGQTVATSTGSTSTITYTTPQFNIGFRDINGTTDPYTGNISQTTIYNRALSLIEIQQNYNATRARFGL